MRLLVFRKRLERINDVRRKKDEEKNGNATGNGDTGNYSGLRRIR